MSRHRLAGWKEIANFVRRDVRTVQNWERARGLPVHRLPGGNSSTVFGYVDEVTAWLDGGVNATSCAQQVQAVPGLLVLPFEGTALDPAHAFVGDGLAQELIGRLAALSLASVRVVSWTTARTVHINHKPAQAIATELGVRWIVEGAVLRAVDRWTVAVRIVDAEADRIVLAHRFACGGPDILHLQSDVAEAVAGHLALHLAGDLCEPMWTRATDPHAFLALLDGTRKAARGTDEAMAAALRAFDEALSRDPGLLPARAHRGLALLQSEHHTAWLRPEVKDEVRALSARCDEEAPALVSGAILSSLIGRNDCDWDRVDRRLSATVAASPSAVAARLMLGGNLTLRRHFDAAREALAPVDGLERSLEADKAIGAAHLWSRDFDGAIARFDAILAREPDHMYASIMRFMAAIYARDVPAARRYGAAVTPSLRVHYDAFVEGCIAAIEGRATVAAACRDEVERRAAAARLGWYHVAMIDGLLGDAARATAYVSRSFAQHEAVCSLGAVDPSFDLVRGDARFRAAVRAMGLPD